MAFDSFVAELNKYSGLPYPLRAAAFNLRNHFQRHLLFHAVYGRAFVEYRFPYCDLPLLTFCFGLPYEFGDERRLQKAIISRVKCHIWQVLDAVTTNCLFRIEGRRDALQKSDRKSREGFAE